MLDVMTNAPNDPNYAKVFIGWLIEEGDLGDAAAWLRNLPADSADSLRFNSILLVKQKKSQEAAKKLTDISRLAKTPAQAANVSNVALIMEELGADDPRFYDLAERQWKRYVALRPSESRRLVEFYSRVPGGKKLKEALSLCEREIGKAIKAKDANVMKYYFQLALQGLRSNKDNLSQTPEHVARVTKWFDVAKKHSLDDLQLNWLEVDFYDIQGNTAKLDTLYREFLTRSDATDLQKAIVRNNLAFQLAVNGNGQEALNVIGDAIDQLGPRADFLDTRALAYLASGDFDNAIKDLNTAITAGSESGSMLFHLALAYDGKGDQQLAADTLHRAIGLGLTEKDLAPAEAKQLKRLKDKVGSLMPQEQPQL